MSSSDRRTFLTLLAAAPLAACGFTPAYGPAGPARNLQGAIRVADPADKNGFDLVERLEERLGRPDAARYDLRFLLVTKSIGVGVMPDNTITRYNLVGTVDWRLTERGTGRQVTAGKVQNFTSWSATTSTVAGLAAEEDAAFRLMRILADQIVTQLVATSGKWLK
ncbi:MAG: LPS assembly lipoprotein LptE [Paracoccaceae bacterium]